MSVPTETDPFQRFAQWYADAKATREVIDHTAMCLATADPDGMPDARMVLLKEFDATGFVFYTNLGSVKARQLAENPQAALLFHWAPLERQIRIRGAVEPVTAAEADAYFASRPRDSQIGAWASKQSQPYAERWELEKRVAAYAAKFGIAPVPRPDFWSGFRLLPTQFEFWSAQPFRLHDRLEFHRAQDGTWSRHRLFP